MSLSQLLNVGKKAPEEPPEPPIPPIESPLGFSQEVAVASGPPGGAVAVDSEERELARYLVESQEEVLKEEAEKRAAEDSRLAKEAIEKAAETAKLLAQRSRGIAGNSLSTGSSASAGSEITADMDPEEWLNKHQITDVVRRQFIGLEPWMQKKVMKPGMMLYAQDQSAVLVSRIRNLMVSLGAPQSGRNVPFIPQPSMLARPAFQAPSMFGQQAQARPIIAQARPQVGGGDKVQALKQLASLLQTLRADSDGGGGSSGFGGGGSSGSFGKGSSGASNPSSSVDGCSGGGKGCKGAGKVGGANAYGPAGVQSQTQRASPFPGSGQQRPAWGW